MGYRDIVSTLSIIIPILILCSFAAIASLPEGYEAPLTMYYALYSASLIATIYLFHSKKDSKRTLFFSLSYISVLLFFFSNLGSRRLIRALQRFPSDSFATYLFDFISLPLIVLHWLIDSYELKIPWIAGWTLSAMIVLISLRFISRKMPKVLGAHDTADNPSARASREQPYSVTSDHSLFNRLGFLFVGLIAFSVRALPALTHTIPAGCDTPLYVSAMQNKIPSEYIGGPLRQILYGQLLTLGAVLQLPYPIPPRYVILVEVIPILYHTINALLLYAAMKTCIRDVRIALFSAVFMATALGVLRITWDLYKLILTIPFSLITLQLFSSSLKTGRKRSILLSILFLGFTISSHLTLGGLLVFTLALALLMRAVSYENSAHSLLLKSRILTVVVVFGILILPSVSSSLARRFLFSDWYSGNIGGFLPSTPEVGVASLVGLFRWVGVIPLLFAFVALISTWNFHQRDVNPFRFWFIVSLFMIEQALFHTYSSTSQIHRVELIASIPVAAVAGMGVARCLDLLRSFRRPSLSVPSVSVTVFIVVASVFLVAWHYGGFISSSMITEGGYVSMNWLIAKAPNTNCGVPSNFDSWTGFYGRIQNYEIPTTFFIDRGGIDGLSAFNRVYDGSHYIHKRNILI